MSRELVRPMVVDRQRRLPAADRLVQDKAAVGLHRAAEKHGHAAKRARRCQRHVDALEQAPPASCRRAIDDHADGALFVVFADIDEVPEKYGSVIAGMAMRK